MKTPLLRVGTSLAASALMLAACGEEQEPTPSLEPSVEEAPELEPAVPLAEVEPPPNVDVMVGFEMRVDFVTGEVDIQVTDEWYRSQYVRDGDLVVAEQALGFCPVPSPADGVIGSQEADTFEIYSTRAFAGASDVMVHGEDDGTGGVWDCSLDGSLVPQYELFGAFCTDILVRSYYGIPIQNVHAQIDQAVPTEVRGYAFPAPTGAQPLPGLNNALGLWSYGDFEAGDDVPQFGTDLILSDDWRVIDYPDEKVRRWAFEFPAGAAIDSVYYRGRLMAQFAEDCDSLDNDCDGRIDEGAGCFPDGLPCEDGTDCVSGICAAGTCGAANFEASRVNATGGGGRATNATGRTLDVRVGAPQPIGESSSTNFRLRVGPASGF